MKLLDDFTKKLLEHIFNNKSVSSTSFSNTAHLKVEYLTNTLGLTEKEFLQKESFTSKEKINVIICLLNEGYSAYHLFKFLNWKDFEELVETIFENRAFFVEKNFRFKNNGHLNEIDVMAFKYPHLFLIDCKFHKKDSPSSLKLAAVKQKERALNLLENFPHVSDYLIKKLSIPVNQMIYAFPVIVSWYEIELHLDEEVPIVPFRLINGFIAEIDEIRDNLFHLRLVVN